MMNIQNFKEIHIENTNSCAYKCTMCPRDQQTRKIGYMSMDDFSLVLDRIGPYKGIFHLHGFGETLLDRKFIEKMALLKKRLPDSQALIFSTLGVKVKEDYFLRLIESGLDAIVISLYGFNDDEYKKVHGFDGFSLVKKNLQLLSDARKLNPNAFTAVIKVPGGEVSSSLPMLHLSQRDSFCKWGQDLGFQIGEWSYVHNFGSGRNYNEPELTTMCPVVNGNRKKILNITWDLNVVPCCFDFNSSIKWGNIKDQTFDQIFSSSEYFNFLLAHKTGNLTDYPICQNCEKVDSN